MRYRVPLTWKDIREHFRYHAWAYLAIAALSIGLWSLIYTQTAYRSPQDKRIDLYIQSALADQDQVNAYLEPLRLAAVPQEEVVSAVLLLPATQGNEYYASVQLTTYIGAGEGDIYILSTQDFKRYAAQGVFVDLGPAMDSGVLRAEGLNLASGRVALVETTPDGGLRTLGENRQFGIPLFDLPGFFDKMQIDNRDLVMGLAVNSGNEEDTLAFMDALIQDTRKAE